MRHVSLHGVTNKHKTITRSGEVQIIQSPDNSDKMSPHTFCRLKSSQKIKSRVVKLYNQPY